MNCVWQTDKEICYYRFKNDIPYENRILQRK
jgi:hypothetical protein